MCVGASRNLQVRRGSAAFTRVLCFLDSKIDQEKRRHQLIRAVNCSGGSIMFPFNSIECFHVSIHCGHSEAAEVAPTLCVWRLDGSQIPGERWRCCFKPDSQKVNIRNQMFCCQSSFRHVQMAPVYSSHQPME